MEKPSSVNPAASDAPFPFRFLLAGLVATGVLLLLPSDAFAPQFLMASPSVRVTPNTSVEFKWITDVTWFGQVEVFDSNNNLILGRRSEDAAGDRLAATDHVVSVPVVNLLAADTGYFFRVTATSSTDPTLSFVTPTPLPPFFTGAQAIGDVFVDPDFDRAVISWSANVIGFGRVTYGAVSPTQLGPIQDAVNVTDHAIELTGLSSGTTYQFQVSNVHALDGDALASTQGSFTTQGVIPTARLRQALARPRTISPGFASTLSVLIMQQDTPLSGVPVDFEVLSDSMGGATINGGANATAFTDATGKAMVVLTGVAPGLVRVNASSPATEDSINIPVVVH